MQVNALCRVSDLAFTLCSNPPDSPAPEEPTPYDKRFEEFVGSLPGPVAPALDLPSTVLRGMVRLDVDFGRSEMPTLPFLQFWEDTYTSAFPVLRNVAQVLPCFPPTSTASESVFSISGNLARARRSSLAAGTLGCLVFLGTSFSSLFPTTSVFLCVYILCCNLLPCLGTLYDLSYPSHCCLTSGLLPFEPHGCSSWVGEWVPRLEKPKEKSSAGQQNFYDHHKNF